MSMHFLIEDDSGEIRKATEKQVSEKVDMEDTHNKKSRIHFMDAGGLKHPVYVGVRYILTESEIYYAIADLEVRSPTDDRFRFVVGHVMYKDH